VENAGITNLQKQKGCLKKLLLRQPLFLSDCPVILTG